MLSRQNVGTYTGEQFHTSLSGNTQPQSSQLVEPLRTDPGIKGGINVHELISNEKSASME